MRHLGQPHGAEGLPEALEERLAQPRRRSGQRGLPGGLARRATAGGQVGPEVRRDAARGATGGALAARRGTRHGCWKSELEHLGVHIAQCGTC